MDITLISPAVSLLALHFVPETHALLRDLQKIIIIIKNQQLKLVQIYGSNQKPEVVSLNTLLEGKEINLLSVLKYRQKHRETLTSQCKQESWSDEDWRVIKGRSKKCSQQDRNPSKFKKFSPINEHVNSCAGC